ncbi:MAG: recombinase family protein [Clostridia bacterium]|nr:recombinase family protein [Clostridia bacterium]
MMFYIYSRKSVLTGKGESIENQVEMCKNYVKTKFSDDDIHFSIYEDEGFSAKDTNRPKFKQMLADIKNSKPDFIVCYRLDRISRCVSDFSLLIEKLNQYGISFLCIKEEFDTSKPIGKAMMYIASVFAQLERETIAERVKDNMLELAKSGRWLGGTTPFGFLSKQLRDDQNDGKKRTLSMLCVNDEEMKTVKLIFDSFLSSKSIDAVRKILFSKQIKTRSGKDFTNAAIKQILTNAVYCSADAVAHDYFTSLGALVCFCPDNPNNGILTYNKRDYRKRSAPYRDVSEWIITCGQHKGIISGKTFVTIQRQLKNKTFQRSQNVHLKTPLLSGKIYCKRCGSKMLAKRRGQDKFDYICSRKLQNGRDACGIQNLSGIKTDKMVLTQIINVMPRKEKLLKELGQVKFGKESSKPIVDDSALKLELINHIVEKIEWDGHSMKIFLP